MKQQVKKAVLAYSGGLGTSIIIPWLKENYGCEVIAVVADVGQDEHGKAGDRRQAIDVLDDQRQITVLRGEWIDSIRVRGTGCMLSSAIAALLAQRMPLEESARAAKQFVAHAIRYAPKLGPDPVTLELTEMTKLEN